MSDAVPFGSLDDIADGPAWDPLLAIPDAGGRTGEDGLASRDDALTAGEEGLGMPPIALIREPGLGRPVARRDAGPGVAEGGGVCEPLLSASSALLGPATRRNRSSS